MRAEGPDSNEEESEFGFIIMEENKMEDGSRWVVELVTHELVGLNVQSKPERKKKEE